MPKRILIADDDLTMHKLLSLHVEQMDLDVAVVAAEDGEETISMIDTHEPSVLVLDLRMPKADGFKVLEHMRAQGKQTPVVILTNYPNPEYKERCKQHNVKAYLVKQHSPMSTVVSAVMEHIEA